MTWHPVFKTGKRPQTSYHHLALDFKFGILTLVLEEEIHITDHRECSDIVIGELETSG
jgi:hypothetical protein